MKNTLDKNTDPLGLETAIDRKGAEYDLVKALLEAADFRSADTSITEVEIRRGGKYLFSVHVHPLGDDEVRQARKHATTYGRDPRGAKYPQIEKEFNPNLFNSWMIYLATTEDDQTKIWGNSAVRQKCGLLQNVDSVDALLRFGEKAMLLDKISEISGLDEETPFDAEDYAKK